jgi:hypothetical protein
MRMCWSPRTPLLCPTKLVSGVNGEGKAAPKFGQFGGSRETGGISPLSVCLLHVDVYISHYSGPSAGAGGAGISAIALYDYQGGKFEAT